MTKEEKAANAVRTLAKLADADNIVLRDDVFISLCLVAFVHDRETAATSRSNGKKGIKPGTVEYMVSDGPPGRRGTSFDYTSLKDALECYNMIAALGWKGYAKKQREELGHQLTPQ